MFPDTLCGNALKQWINMEGFHIRIACMVKNNLLQELCCLVSDKELLFVKMDAGSSSSNASSAAKTMEVKIRELKHDFKLLQNQVNAIDCEGGGRLDNVGKDLVFLRRKLKGKVKRSENALIRLIAEMEIKVDKLALKLSKHKASVPGFSSSLDG